VDLAVAQQDFAIPVEEEGGVVAASGVRIAHDRAAEDGEAGRSSRVCERLMTRAIRGFGIFVARLSGQGCPLVEREFGQHRQPGTKLPGFLEMFPETAEGTRIGKDIGDERDGQPFERQGRRGA